MPGASPRGIDRLLGDGDGFAAALLDRGRDRLRQRGSGDRAAVRDRPAVSGRAGASDRGAALRLHRDEEGNPVERPFPAHGRQPLPEAEEQRSVPDRKDDALRNRGFPGPRPREGRHTPAKERIADVARVVGIGVLRAGADGRRPIGELLDAGARRRDQRLFRGGDPRPDPDDGVEAGPARGGGDGEARVSGGIERDAPGAPAGRVGDDGGRASVLERTGRERELRDDRRVSSAGVGKEGRVERRERRHETWAATISA